jgi:hypothetical protein
VIPIFPTLFPLRYPLPLFLCLLSPLFPTLSPQTLTIDPTLGFPSSPPSEEASSTGSKNLEVRFHLRNHTIFSCVLGGLGLGSNSNVHKPKKGRGTVHNSPRHRAMASLIYLLVDNILFLEPLEQHMPLMGFLHEVSLLQLSGGGESPQKTRYKEVDWLIFLNQPWIILLHETMDSKDNATWILEALLASWKFLCTDAYGRFGGLGVGWNPRLEKKINSWALDLLILW